MPGKQQVERRENAAAHCLMAIPYRMVVYDKDSQHGTPLYRVAGSAAPARKATAALKKAFEVHGGHCFFCRKKLTLDELSIDHAEPIASGGKEQLQNLLIACRPCNRKKAGQAIEAFAPDAGREWLLALLKQVEDRLNRLGV